ncbi:GNAT family N-acetyltransferase [Hyphomicrobium sp.]|uniref:GNAT family N-acetyltransferase n=1 Tax=Hyphomicrobium sp. TaxID=82 RepID=UPI000FBF25DD|nr:N-acetyltransferase [Hyphomicrobium sp.]RUO99402.1 MAG: N-acetyltransferase [Hyphomicrobium sp.]
MSPPLVIRPATPADIVEISKLHARVFGPGRFARSAYRVREGKGHLSRFCLVACLGETIIASIRNTEISIGGKSGAVLLGPVAVDGAHRSLGLGKTLIHDALAAAKTGGAKLMVLVGDQPYYGRFGFKPVPMGQIVFPGPVNPQRILACELVADALSNYRGIIAAEPQAEARAQIAAKSVRATQS